MANGRTIMLPNPVWAGGSGDLSSANWITGYVLDTATNTVLSLIFGTISATANALFLPVLALPNYSSDSVGAGGDLSGSLTAARVTLSSGAAYDLTGSIIGGVINQANGALTVDGSLGGSKATVSLNGAAQINVGLSANDLEINGMVSDSASVTTNILNISGGEFTLSDGASVATKSFGVTGGQVTVGNRASVDTNTLSVNGGLITVSGNGSALMISGSPSNQSPVAINQGGNVIVNAGATASWNRNVLIGSNGSGSLSTSGPGSKLTVEGYLQLGVGQLTISNGAAAMVAGTAAVVGVGCTVTVTGSTLTLERNSYSLDIYAGLVTINDGGTVSATSNAIVGNGASGTLAIDGSASTLSVGGTVFVGFPNSSTDPGTGLLTISAGAKMSVMGDVYGGYDQGALTPPIKRAANIAVDGNGSSLTVGGALDFGLGGQGLLVVNNGATVSGRSLTIFGGSTVSTDSTSSIGIGTDLTTPSGAHSHTGLEVGATGQVSLAGGIINAGIAGP
jgi:T5SS/PEP-CTERM-associated repeat protein